MNRREKLTGAGVCLAIALSCLALFRSPSHGDAVIGAATDDSTVARTAKTHTLNAHSAATASVDVGSQKLINVANGTTTGDAVHFGQTSTPSTTGLQTAADKTIFDNFFTNGPRLRTQDYDDFNGGGADSTGAAAIPTGIHFGKLQWRASVSNSGTVTYVTTAQDKDHIGIIQLETVTSTSSTSAFGRFANGVMSEVLGSGVTGHREFAIRFPNLSDGTNTWVWRAGWLDSGGNPTNSCHLEYSSAAPSSGDFICRTCVASSCATAGGGSGVTVAANTWYLGSVDWDGTNCSCRSGSTLLGTTATVPTAAVSPITSMVRSAGTASRTVLVDWYAESTTWSSTRVAM